MIKTLNEKDKMFVLKNNYIGYLGYIDKSSPCVVPITYFYDEEQNTIICYSGLGHKINALRKHNLVSISICDINTVYDWKSILVHGTYKEKSGSTAKSLLHQFSLGIKDLILRKEMKDLDFINQFSSKLYTDDMPIVFTIDINEITGKMRKY